MKRIISFIMAMLMLSGILFLASCDFSIDDLSNFSFDDIFSTKTSVSDFIDKYNDEAYSKFVNINEKGSVLGRGYDIINSDYFNVDGIKRGKIIDENKLDNLNFAMIESGNSSYYSAYGETLYELNENFNANLGIGASYGMFSASFDVSQKANGWTKNANAYGVMEYIVNAFRIDMDNTYAEIRECLTDEFMKDLTNENLKPQDLFDKYGTHMIKSAIMGGRIESLYEFSSQDSSFSKSTSLKIEAGFKKMTFSANGSFEESFSSTLSESNVSEKFSAHCFAGTKNLIDVSSHSQICANLEKWVKNFSEDISASAFCGVSSIKESLIPLWELIPDDDKYVNRKLSLLKAYNSLLTKSKDNMKYNGEDIENELIWYDNDGVELNLDVLRFEIDNKDGLYLRERYNKIECEISYENYQYIETVFGKHEKAYDNGYVTLFKCNNESPVFLILQEMKKLGYNYKLQYEVESEEENRLALIEKMSFLEKKDLYANMCTYFELAVGNNKKITDVLVTSQKMGYVSQTVSKGNVGGTSSKKFGNYKSSSIDLSKLSLNDNNNIRLYYYRYCEIDNGSYGTCSMYWAPFTIKCIITVY